MDSVFDLFPSDPYVFLKIKQQAEGNTVETEYSAEGIFKIRGGMSQGGDIETPTADATLRIKPSEPFVALLEADLVGHGIRASRDGNTPLEYRIMGQTEGYDHDTKVLDFYLVTLKRENVAEWEMSDLPLE